MTPTLIRTLALVTVGALMLGHGVVRLAARQVTGAALAPTFAIALGTIAVGLAHQASGALALALQGASAALVMAGLVVLVRRRSRSLG